MDQQLKEQRKGYRHGSQGASQDKYDGEILVYVEPQAPEAFIIFKRGHDNFADNVLLKK